jgi:ELWxxDGT repeat protein
MRTQAHFLVPQLWQSDGTLAGTTRVADVYPGAAGASPGGFTLSGGLLYFKAFDPAGGAGRHLFVHDPGATAQPYGHGCGTAADTPTMSATNPVLGAMMTLSGASAPAPMGLVMLGVPLRAGLQYVPGCRLWIDIGFPFIDLFMFPTAGAWSLSVPVPNDPGLISMQMGAQAGIPLLGAPLGIALSNGVLLRFGS